MEFHHIILLATQAVAETAHAAEAAHDTGVLGTLGIDWRLFVAQLVNFTIVLLIFWKWVVKPLGRTLTERQEKIESGLKNAEYMEEEKRKFEEWKSAQMQKVRESSEQAMKTAADTAEKIKAETITAAQAQSEKMIEQAKSAIDQEKALMLKEVRAGVSDLVTAAAEKIVKAKLDGKQDQALIQDSLKGLK